jgi:hypothetical protein
MTLDTRIAVRAVAPVTAREIFTYCRALLDTPDRTTIKDEVEKGNRKGQKSLWHEPGLGLDAWLIMYYGADGPMQHVCTEFCPRKVGLAEWDEKKRYHVTQADIDEHREEIAADPTENGWATVEISIDTGYSFMNDRGESCSDRHARFIHELGLWLDGRGCEWKWKNEYTGEWHDGREGLEDFGSFHMSEGGPAEWFAGAVIPAIISHLSAEEEK